MAADSNLASAAAAAGEQSDGSAKTPQIENVGNSHKAPSRPEGNAESQKAQSQPPAAADPKEQHARQLSTDGQKEPPKVGLEKKKRSYGVGAVVGLIMLALFIFGIFTYIRRKKAAEQAAGGNVPEQSEESMT